MNRELITPIVTSVIRHAITVYGGSRLLSGELSVAIEGIIAIAVALVWSYLEKKSPKVDASKSEPKP